jgi:hypothetical protein
MGNTIGGWEGISGAFYTGYGSNEGLIVIVTIIMCVGALWWSNRHESKSYKK